MASFFGKFGKKKETDEKSAPVKSTRDEKVTKEVKKRETKTDTNDTKNSKATKDTKTKSTKKDTTSSNKASTFTGTKENLARVLTNPRVTEKATLGIENRTYTFDIAPDANKKQIKEAIKLVYNVDPVKVHVTKIAKKKKRNARTGIYGVKSGGKKAYVYLKKGDSITLM